MNILKKILLSLILVLTMFTSVISVNYVRAEDGDEETSTTITKADNELVFSLLDSEGKEIKSDGDTKLSNGDSITIQAQFELPNSVTSKYLLIELGSLDYISNIEQTNVELKNSGTRIGSFDVIKNETTENDKTTTSYQIKAQYDYEALKTEFPNQSNFTCTIKATGKLDLGDNAEPTDNVLKIKVGDSEFDVPFRPQDTVVNITKSSLGDGTADTDDNTNDNLKLIDIANDSGNTTSYFYKKFEVNLTSTGDNKDVKIVDTLSSTDLEYVREEDTTNSISAPTLTISTPNSETSGDNANTSTTKTLDSESFKVTTSNGSNVATVEVTDSDTVFSKGSTATLTYWVRFLKSKYNDVNNKTNSASTTYTNNNGVSSSNAPEKPYVFELSTPTVNKTVEKTSDSTDDTKKLKWTIRVTGCAFNDGYVITDKETLSGDSTYTDTTSDTSDNTTNSNTSTSRLTNKGNVKIYLEDDSNTYWMMSYENFAGGKLSLTSDSSEQTTASTSETDLKTDDVKVNLANGKNLKIEYINGYNVKDVKITSGFKTSNVATASNENLGTSVSSKNAEYEFVPGQGVSVSKRYTSYDPSTGTITWEVIVIAPSDFTDLKLIDTPSSNISIESDLKIGKSDSSASITEATDTTAWTTDNGSYTVDLTDAVAYDGTATKDGYTGKYKKYVLTYTSKITDGKTDAAVNNKVGVDWKYDGKEGTRVGTTNNDSNFAILISKSGYSADSTSGKQSWTVQFNVEAMDFSDSSSKKVTISDTLPENLELIKESLKLGDTSLNSTDISLSTSEVDGKQVFTADLTSALKTYKSSNSNTKYVYLTYQTKFTSLKKAYDKTQSNDTKYTNSITATYDGLKITKTADVYSSFVASDTIEKTFTYSNDDPNTVTYTIKMNKSALPLANEGETTLSITDTAGSALTYKNEKKGDLIVKADNKEIEDYVVEYDLVKNSMTISNLPDEKVIEITYKCQINLAENTNAASLGDDKVGNSVSFNGANGVPFAKSSKFNKQVRSASGSTYPSSASITICKVDKDDNETKLSGAVFKASMMIIEDGKLREYKDSDNVINYGGPITSEETGEDGTVTISGIFYNYVYCIEEIKAPDGYSTGEKFYVLFDGKNGTTDTSKTISDDDIKNLGVDIKHIYNYIGTTNVIVKDSKITEGEITITKTYAGDVSKEDVENSTTFVVKPSDSNSTYKTTSYKLSEFKYDENTKTWSLKLSNMPLGEYTITETSKNIDGYNLESSYDLNKVTKNGNSVTVTLDYKGVDVAYLNKYTKIETKPKDDGNTDNGGTTDSNNNNNNNTNNNTNTNKTCEGNFVYSESANGCVYRVSNTSSK